MISSTPISSARRLDMANSSYALGPRIGECEWERVELWI
jgi:hypothetical protein